MSIMFVYLLILREEIGEGALVTPGLIASALKIPTVHVNPAANCARLHQE